MEQNTRNERACWILVGGRRRLGRALAEDLARDYDLVVTGSQPWAGEGWVEALSKTGQIQTLLWNAEDPDLVSRMMADMDTLEAGGRVISGAVILAGTFPESPLGTWGSASLAAQWQVNLTFPFLCAQVLAPRLVEGACLQLLLDTAIHRPWLRRLPYSAAKAGLAALVPGLAQLLAPRVRVVGHAPGVLLPEDGSDGEHLAGRNLLRRNGDPQDLIRAVRFAAASPFLTGEILTQDGGRRWVDR